MSIPIVVSRVPSGESVSTVFSKHRAQARTGLAYVREAVAPILRTIGRIAFMLTMVANLTATPLAAQGLAATDPVAAPSLVDVCSSNITVTSTSNSGAGSLRQALLDGCAGGTIDFDPALTTDNPATITITSNTLTVTHNLTLTGPGAGLLSISGNSSLRVFYINSAITVTMSGFTIRDGKAGSKGGGGIYNNSSLLALSDMVITANTANPATTLLAPVDGTAIIDSPETKDGGGLYNYHGTVTMSNVTFSHNTASNDGGAIYNEHGTIKVEAGTYYRNTSANDGGAFSNHDGVVSLTNGLIISNTAAKHGGAIASNKVLTLTNSTLSSNAAKNDYGGGIFIADHATLWFYNTLIAGSVSGGDCKIDRDATIVANATNFVADGSCNPAHRGDPQLGAITTLADGTWMQIPLPYSPVVDAGNATYCPATDRRGVTRPQGTVCDIGAIELKYLTVTPSAGDNGVIEAGDVQTVTEGASITFTITANRAWQIDDVLVDGTSVGDVSIYVFGNVTTSHTISATFKVLCIPVAGLSVTRMTGGDLIVNNLIHFEAVATGTLPMTSAWTLNGNPVGSNQGWYEQIFDTAGDYAIAVTVTNGCGQTSAEMLFTVIQPEVPHSDLSRSEKIATRNVDSITYTLLLRNAVAVDRTILMTDPIPSGVHFVSDSLTASYGTASYVDGQVLWSGVVLSGTPAMIVFAVALDTEVPPDTVISNLAMLDDGLGTIIYLPADATMNPTLSLIINDGATMTRIPTVTLTYSSTLPMQDVRFSNDPLFLSNSGWMSTTESAIQPDWIVEQGGDLRLLRTVYVQFRDAAGVIFGPVYAAILFDPDPPIEPDLGVMGALPPVMRQRALYANLPLTVTVDIGTGDTNSGVQMVVLANDVDFTDAITYTFNAAFLSVEWQVPSTLFYVPHIFAKSIDRAGNVSVIQDRPLVYQVYIFQVMRPE